MPIYEYKCPVCGREYEKLHSYSESTEVLCSHGRDMGMEVAICRRIISRPGLIAPGGAEGKCRTGKQIEQRNAEYARSSKGKDEHRANIEAARKRGLPA